MYMHMYMYMYMYMHLYMYMYNHMYMYLYIMYMYLYLYIYIYTRICVYIYIYMHMYMYMYMCKSLFGVSLWGGCYSSPSFSLSLSLSLGAQGCPNNLGIVTIGREQCGILALSRNFPFYPSMDIKRHVSTPFPYSVSISVWYAKGM